jgi:hypothetical protein
MSTSSPRSSGVRHRDPAVADDEERKYSVDELVEARSSRLLLDGIGDLLDPLVHLGLAEDSVVGPALLLRSVDWKTGGTTTRPTAVGGQPPLRR